MKDWQQRYELYIAQWPSMLQEYKALPQWHKNDCAYAMKWWVALGLMEQNT